MTPTNQPSASRLKMAGSRARKLAPAFFAPGFPILWGATICSQIGMGMQQVLLSWVALTMTDSSSMVGVIFAVRSAPNLLVGFVAGAMTDRLDRRLLMRLTVGGTALASWGIAWLLLVGHLRVWQLLLYAGIVGTLRAFEETARQTYACDVVGISGAVQSIALLSLAQRLGGILGSLLAGATLQWWGNSVSFWVMGLSYGIGAGVLGVLRHRGTAAPLAQESLWQNVLAYGRELRTNRVMQSLMLSTAGAELLGFSHQVILPILAKEVLHSGAAGLGILTAARFLGGVLGGGILTTLGAVRHHGALLLATLVLFGIGQVGLAHVPYFWLAVGCVIYINMIAAATDILHLALLQYSVANEQRGRAMGAWIVGIGTAPLGQLEMGYLVGLAGAPLALLLNGMALIALAGVLALCLPRLRRL